MSKVLVDHDDLFLDLTHLEQDGPMPETVREARERLRAALLIEETAIAKPDVTLFEHAQLLLQAFGLIDGWGHRNEKNEWTPNGRKERCKLAEDLVGWALGEEEP